jgi:ketosteroid isomerase-like protein
MSAKAIVAELYERFTVGDMAGVSTLLSPDVDWDEGDGHPYGRHRGFAAVSANVFSRLGAEWEGMATRIEQMLEDPSGRVVVLGRDTAVNKATGKKVDSRVAHVYTVRAGQIVSFLQFCDTAAWRDAMPAESG